MKNFKATSSNMDATTEILRSTPFQHPVLQRLSAKLNDGSSTVSGISRYDRMHHRHNRT